MVARKPSVKVEPKKAETEFERAVQEVLAAKNLEERRANERKYFNGIKNSPFLSKEEDMYLIDIEWVK